MKLICSAFTHPGNIRKENQDRIYLDGVNCAEDGVKRCKYDLHNDEFAVFAVFDGMGGERCGDIASKISVEFMLNYKNELKLSELCYIINEKICKFASDNAISSMGSTAAMLKFYENRVDFCNIGDSRIYRIFDDEIEMISIDHSITMGGTRSHRMLTQHLGIPKSEIVIEPHIGNRRVISGERYLICSDGLSDMLDDNEIKDIVANNEASTAAEKLLKAALDSGGKDNVSAIICQII